MIDQPNGPAFDLTLTDGFRDISLGMCSVVGRP